MPGLFGAGLGLRPRSLTTRRCATATTTSSTARRPGRRWRSMPTGSSAWCAPTRRQAAGRHLLPADRHESPGITVRPIITIDGAHEVNEVFLDNVRVPVENRIGEENKGWTYAKFLLGNERTSIAGVGAFEARPRAASSRSWRPRSTTAIRRSRRVPSKDIARLEVDVTALETTELRVLAADNARHRSGAGGLAAEDPRHRDLAAHHRADPQAIGTLRPAHSRTTRSAQSTSCRGRTTAPPRRRQYFNIAQDLASTAARTRSSATSSPKRCWAVTDGTRNRMDFELTEEQELLRSSVQRLLRERL